MQRVVDLTPESHYPSSRLFNLGELLSRVAWLGLPVTGQHVLLADVGGMARKAISAAMRLKELETAVKWAEQGRPTVWKNMLGLRTPFE